MLSGFLPLNALTRQLAFDDWKVAGNFFPLVSTEHFVVLVEDMPRLP